MKFKLFILIASLISLAMVNQFGDYYLDYSIDGKSKIKANILRYFLSSYWEDSVVNDSTSYIIQFKGNEISKKFVQIKANEKTVYYIQPDYETNALGDYEFYISENNGNKLKIEIGMAINPDSLSNITLNKYSNLEINRMEGKVKVDPSENILERGNSFLQAILEGNLEANVINSTEINKIIDTSDDFRKMLEKDLRF